MENTRIHTAVVLANDAMDFNPCWETVRLERQLNGNEQVVHLEKMANIFKVRENMQQSIMHLTEASVEPFLGDWFVAEVKVEGVAVICNTIKLKSVPKPLKLPAAILVLTLSLHLERLIIDQEILSKDPCFLPNLPEPAKELVHFEVWAHFFSKEA